MGNSFGKSRLINLVKSKFINQPKLNWPEGNKLIQATQRQIVPAKITALIPYEMPPNKARAAKAVAPGKMKPEEKAEANGEADGEAVTEIAEQATKGKKKAAPKENGTSDKPAARPTRAAKAEVPVDEVAAEAPKAAGRSKKKVTIDVPGVETSAVEPKKISRGKKKEADKEEEPEDEPPKKAARNEKKLENEDKVEEAPKKSGRGRKKVEDKPEEETVEEAPKKSGRGRKKVETEEKPEEDEVEEEAPKKSGRGRKKAEAEEKPEEEEAEKETPKKTGRGRKKAEAVENGDKAEEEAPRATRSKKKAGEEVDEKPAKVGKKVAPKKEEAPEEKEPIKRGRKAAVKKPASQSSENGEESSEPSAKKAKTDDAKPMTKLDEIDFGCEKVNAKGDKYNLKVCSWNVAGLRSVMNKLGVEYCLKEDADIILLQETKCDVDKLPEEWEFPGYKRYYVDSEKSGYAGVVMYTKKEPLNIKYGLEYGPCKTEGRLITAEYEGYYVINVYVPNAGRDLVNLAKRLQWNDAFKQYVKELDEKKPVIICGDMNVAHTEIDLTNPKTNTKNAGFTKEEREGMTDFLSAGFVDTFRHLYPDKTGAYTFWSYMRAARTKNIGWRLDYFIVSDRIKDNICDNVMRSSVFGSDHCPIILYANL